MFVQGDVRSEESCANAVAKCASAFGGIDILINCAAIGVAGWGTFKL